MSLKIKETVRGDFTEPCISVSSDIDINMVEVFVISSAVNLTYVTVLTQVADSCWSSAAGIVILMSDKDMMVVTLDSLANDKQWEALGSKETAPRCVMAVLSQIRK